jgi:hypothetical protein
VSDLKRYEEELAQRLKNLPLPNKNLAWGNMEKLLDEDDNDTGGAIPPPNRNNILLGLFILLFVVGILCLFIRSQKPSAVQKEVAANANNSVKNVTGNIEKDNAVIPDISRIKIDDNIQNKKNIPEKENVKNSNDLSIENKIEDKSSRGNKKSNPVRLHSSKKNGLQTVVNFSKSNIKNIGSAIKTPEDHLTNETNSIKNKDVVITKKGNAKFNNTNASIEDYQQDQTKPVNEEIKSGDSNKYNLPQKEIVPLSGKIAKRDSNIIKPFVGVSETNSPIAKKKNDKKKIEIYWAAGLSFQQPLNLDCHCLYPSDNYTNTTEVSDFLPSVYIRFYHAKKWFIQTEFKYAAPQYIDEFMYKSKIQNSPFDFVATSYVLKKVYYHQLPVSFNYFVLHNWSVGLGVRYNIFSSEVSQEDIRKKKYELSDSLISSTVIKNKKDSSLSTENYFQALIETEYKWKRFSVGVNYAIGLQSYIKYTDPFSSLPAQKNNNSLNVFIRYELWKSKSR